MIKSGYFALATQVGCLPPLPLQHPQHRERCRRARVGSSVKDGSHEGILQSVEEFYGAVGEVIGALRASGRELDAARLDDVLHGCWTTSSELIGELALALAEMRRDRPITVRAQADDCITFAKHHRRLLGLQ
jgi:hypothetical protein